MQTLSANMGGSETFEKRSDTVFIPDLPVLPDLGSNGACISTLMSIGNEPNISICFIL